MYQMYISISIISVPPNNVNLPFRLSRLLSSIKDKVFGSMAANHADYLLAVSDLQTGRGDGRGEGGGGEEEGGWLRGGPIAKNKESKVTTSKTVTSPSRRCGVTQVLCPTPSIPTRCAQSVRLSATTTATTTTTNTSPAALTNQPHRQPHPLPPPPPPPP